MRKRSRERSGEVKNWAHDGNEFSSIGDVLARIATHDIEMARLNAQHWEVQLQHTIGEMPQEQFKEVTDQLETKYVLNYVLRDELVQDVNKGRRRNPIMRFFFPPKYNLGRFDD